MRDFIKFTFATLTGIILAGVIFSILAIVTVAGIISSSDSETKVKENSIFVLNLKGDLKERSEENPIAELLNEDVNSYGLDDILSSIKKAKENDNIKGIYLRPTFLNTSFASLEEIRNALLDFKKSGKWIISYSDNYTQGMYYLASAADTIVANPMTSLTWHGLSSQPFYYKDFLDKIGVKMQVFKVGTYKSAVEPYISNEMSPANREQLTVLLGSIWDRLLSDVSKSRNIPVDSLNSYANNLLEFKTVDIYKKSGLVDKVMYNDEFKSYLKRLTDCDEDDNLRTLNLDDMIHVKKNVPKDKSGNIIAVYYAEGEIGAGVSNQEEINPNKVCKGLRKLRDNDDVKAVVLRVNSPGGSVYGSEQIWHEVVALKEKKPVVISMGDYAASGGYYISCAASRIVADPTTITGSIGIFGMFPDAQNLMNDKLGIHSDVVKTNKYSNIGIITQPLGADESEAIQSYINRGYATFVKRCADGRKLSTADIEKIAQGRVWSGTDALKLKLVDELGGIDKAISVAKKLGKVDSYSLISYPNKENFLTKLLDSKKDNYIHTQLNESLGEYANIVSFMKNIKTMDHFQARIPYELNIK